MTAASRPSVLVVEDENVVAMHLVSSLEKLHYPVAGVASTGEEAVALAESTAPGLILMDVRLRGEMDGICAAEQIQQRYFVPVVFLTAYSDTITLDRARRTHPFGYVLKPFEDRDIEVAIQTALYRHEMERTLRESEKRLEAIVESIGDAVIATDQDKRVTFLNHRAEGLIGWQSARARGRPLTDILILSPDGDIARIPRAGGESVPVEIVESPVLGEGGKATGFVTVLRDLTERLLAQEAHDRELTERAARLAAEREELRERLKSEISAALDDVQPSTEASVPLRRVADLVARSFGECCIIHIAEGPAPLWITAHREPDKAASFEDPIRRWPPDRDGSRGSYAVIRSGRAECLHHVTDDDLVQLAQSPEHLQTLRALGMRSYLCVPLRTRRGTPGTLACISTERTLRYDEGDVAFVQQLADRVGLALDNSRLYREAEESRASAERLYQAEQAARAEALALLRVAEAISEAQLDLAAVVQRVTDEATSLVGANFGAFFRNVVSESGEEYMLYTLSGAPREAFEKFGLPRNTPMFAPTFAGQGTVRLDDVRSDPRYGKMEPHHGMPKGHLPVVSYLAVPVVSRSGVVIGGLFFGHREPGRFTEQHERMAKALAAYAAVAVDNARLFEETRHAEERQARLVRDLERAVRFSEMFVGVVGHDLRNPLAAITTGARVAFNRADSERLRNPIARILNSANRMSRMIDQILDFTRARLGRGIPLQRKTMNLGTVCRSVMDELRTQRDGEVDLRFETLGNPEGSWDDDRLAQLLSNLLGNAIQHRRAGTSALVRIDGRQAEFVTMVVENAGSIPPELVSMIFEPLRGGEQRKREGASGVGLGLYISREIVTAHGGTIRVESDPVADQTRFVVELPRAPLAANDQVFAPKNAGDAS